jgi:catechol 2,3-dioxygenase-like lactoylglutathione lyase family enzyme
MSDDDMGQRQAPETIRNEPMMFKDTKAFSSFSVDDLKKAKKFYSETLGLDVNEIPEGLELHIAGGGIPVFIYPSSDYHAPEHTVLNFLIDDIDKIVDELEKRGVPMEHYDLPEMKTDRKGILRNESGGMGPKAIAWFKDPAGHILSVIQEK